jgi:excisionase family DNA binding protein
MAALHPPFLPDSRLTSKADLSDYSGMAKLSTVQLAKKLGIARDTLHRWIASGELKAPKVTKVGGVSVRLWADADIKRAKAYAKRRYHKKNYDAKGGR